LSELRRGTGEDSICAGQNLCRGAALGSRTPDLRITSANYFPHHGGYQELPYVRVLVDWLRMHGVTTVRVTTCVTDADPYRI
jgi:hypothetical protein